MAKILYRSTNGKSPLVTFREALLRGQAPDYGLYVPTLIPRLSKSELESLKDKSYSEIAFEVLRKFLHEIEPTELKKIIDDSYNFEVPLEKIENGLSLMRLDRGPTASFKDFAARPMARLMHYFAKKSGRSLTVLVSTSGDTGSAVAHAFYGFENINVIVLFPKNGVSEMQRKQMTTLGKNIRAFAVDGNFDDCQALVKQAFNDNKLRSLNLTSANSINFGRLLPQAIYYFYAYSRLEKNIVFSVPCGNFGNLMAGVMAREMELPIRKFVVAVNENDEFPKFLSRGIYRPIEPARISSSNSMNIGHPSNLARIVDLYGGWLYDGRDKKGNAIKKGILGKKPHMKRLRRDFVSFSIKDWEVDNTIKEFYSKYGKLLEPHGAVAWNALQKYIKQNKFECAVSLETADPAKFPDQIRALIGIEPEIPKSLAGLEKKKEKFEIIKKEYKHFRAKILN